jgi:osmotically-inducible protein OsmY
MFGKESISDKTILRDINKQLAKTGMGRSRISATVRGGQVTLTGQLLDERQRRPIMQTLRRVDGMKGVTDRITVKPREAR